MSGSPHRDDLEAALARIAALEGDLAHSEEHEEEQASELARLREEVARLKDVAAHRSAERDEPADRDEDDDDTPAASGKKGARIVHVLVGVLVVSGLLLVFFYAPLKAWLKAHYGRAAVSYTTVVDEQAGVVAVVSKAMSRDPSCGHVDAYWRIELIDVKHGRHLASQVIGNQRVREAPRIARASPGRMWCVVHPSGSRRRLQLRSAKDLSVITSWASLKTRNAKLATGLYGHVLVDASGNAFVTTRSGDMVRIDGASGAARIVRSRTGVWMRRKQHANTKRTDYDGTRYHFARGDSSPKRCLRGTTNTGYPRWGNCAGAAMMLDPVFINSTSGQPLVAGPGHDFIVAHAELVGRGNTHFRISRLSRSKRSLLWTTRVPIGHLTALAVPRHHAMIVFVCQKKHTQSYAVALDPDTGARLWRLEL